jgi:hypothetical protein
MTDNLDFFVDVNYNGVWGGSTVFLRSGWDKFSVATARGKGVVKILLPAAYTSGSIPSSRNRAANRCACCSACWRADCSCSARSVPVSRS